MRKTILKFPEISFSVFVTVNILKHESYEYFFFHFVIQNDLRKSHFFPCRHLGNRWNLIIPEIGF